MTKKTEILLARLQRSFLNLDLTRTVRLAVQLDEVRADPAEIMSVCEKALAEIGDRYAEGEYYIAGLIMAGEIMNRIITLLAPRLSGAGTRRFREKVLIGTVKGDIHDLGKNLAGALLGAYGFEVRDLGVDVPGEEFVKAAREFQPRVIGLSVLLSSCFGQLAETVKLLRGVRGQAGAPYIFVSGNHITEAHGESFGADFHAAAAFDTVRLCEKLAGAR